MTDQPRKATLIRVENEDEMLSSSGAVRYSVDHRIVLQSHKKGSRVAKRRDMIFRVRTAAIFIPINGDPRVVVIPITYHLRNTYKHSAVAIDVRAFLQGPYAESEVFNTLSDGNVDGDVYRVVTEYRTSGSISQHGNPSVALQKADPPWYGGVLVFRHIGLHPKDKWLLQYGNMDDRDAHGLVKILETAGNQTTALTKSDPLWDALDSCSADFL